MTHWFKTHTGRLVNLDRAYDIEVDGNERKRVTAFLTDGHTSVLGLGTDEANARLIAQHIVLTDCSTWEQAVELAGGDGDDSCTTWDKATDHRTGAA